MMIMIQILTTFTTILPTTLYFLTLFFGLISALLVLSTTYLSMKVSLSPDVILCVCTVFVSFFENLRFDDFCVQSKQETD